MRAIILSILAATFFVSSAAAVDMPSRKPGLWDLKMDFEGRQAPARSMKQCIDAATDKMMNSPGSNPMSREQCSKKDVQQVGGTIVVDSICKIGTVTNVSHAVVSGDFNSNYTVKVETQQQGVPASATKMSIAAKWVGPCASGQRPGDMMIEGMTINILDMQRGGMPGGMPPGGAQGMSPRGMPTR
jgi:hypothetical protein